MSVSIYAGNFNKDNNVKETSINYKENVSNRTNGVNGIFNGVVMSEGQDNSRLADNTYESLLKEADDVKQQIMNSASTAQISFKALVKKLSGMEAVDIAGAVSQRPVIFANYAEPYPFKRNTREMHPQGIPSYNIQNVLPADELQTPYCFILHPDLRISEFFIPDKSFPKVTKRYIRTLSKKYFDGR